MGTSYRTWELGKQGLTLVVVRDGFEGEGGPVRSQVQSPRRGDEAGTRAMAEGGGRRWPPRWRLASQHGQAQSLPSWSHSLVGEPDVWSKNRADSLVP